MRARERWLLVISIHGLFLQPQRRIERTMVDIVSENTEACPIGPL
jgi:hypothetical protein